MIGIMQGRLVPPEAGRIQAFPRERWADEFPAAAEAGLDAIEWVYDTYGLGSNPLETDQGVSSIERLSHRHRVAVRSACADYFMDFAFVRATGAEREERLERLRWLMRQAARIGVTRVVLPFVDQSAIGDAADQDAAVDALERALPAAEACGVELHLETSLTPDGFAALLSRLPHPSIKVNYDSGNSSSLGYRPAEEFAAYGKRVGSVHIKDRVGGGGTVPLGEGDADFPALFEALRRAGYAGDFILQVARGPEGDEVAWARKNRAFVEHYLK
jgi:L-ribulose-5-phosphate 3-epimerase